jgi:hypothetical protein
VSTIARAGMIAAALAAMALDTTPGHRLVMYVNGVDYLADLDRTRSIRGLDPVDDWRTPIYIDTESEKEVAL